MTKQKEAIKKVMFENSGHFTAEEIYEMAKKVYPGIARATVYNNLNAMVEAHEVRRISQSGEPDRFDRNPAPHEHIICSSCGRVIDIQLVNFHNRLEKEIGLPIEDYDLVVHCLCRSCRRKASASK